MEQLNSPWPGPAGLIPVSDGKADDANVWNRRYLDHLLIETRFIGSHKPDLHTKLFGYTFDMPIMTPAFSHLNKVGRDGRKPMKEYAQAAKELNLLNWVGMEPDDVYADIAQTGAATIRIIKPFADHQKIKEEILFAKAHGAIGVGIDIDHIAGKDGGYDFVDGNPLGPVSAQDLQEYVALAGIPFIAKGVLSVQDARIAAQAGCAGIVVSHHHGRAPFGIPPVYILPEIKKTLAGTDIKIFVDCGIDSGYDAYKALALGADAVSAGRTILKPLLQDGKQGVVDRLTAMKQQLAEMMIYTGVPDTNHFDPSVIHIIP